ncbi:MAG: heparinase II/III family protein [Verrucomicrobiales bacterium]
MEPVEIAGRVREKWRRVTEDRALGGLSGAGVGEARGSYPALKPPSAAPSALVDGVAREAEAILAGRWHILGGHEVRVASPPDWHRDPISGIGIQTDRPARSLDHRSLPEGADPRSIWEISRWTQVVRLAQAAYLCGNREASDAAIAFLEDWVSKNPVGRGINWTSAMEPGLRLINFTWAHALLSVAGADPARLEALADRIVPPHCWWVWRYKSFGSSANNHLLGELAGLICASARWPGAATFCAPVGELGDLLQREVAAQFWEDGGNREQGLHYHLFAFELCLHALAGLPAESVDPRTSERLSRAAEFFADVVTPGEPWDYGDSDDAHVIPIFADARQCPKEWQAWICGGSAGSAMAYWLGDPLSRPATYEKPSMSWCGWTLYAQTGIAVREEGDWRLRWDLSPLGFGKMAAHGHLDALHLSVWFQGMAVIIDPGTGGYFGADEIRDHLTGWAAHNGPHFPGSDFPRRGGPFLWQEHHARPFTLPDASAVLEISRNKVPRCSGIVAESDRQSTPHLTICRKIDVSDSQLQIADSVGVPFSVHWQIAPDWQVEEFGSSEFRLRRDGVCLSMAIEGGDVTLGRSICAPSFRRIADSPVLRASASNMLTTRLSIDEC